MTVGISKLVWEQGRVFTSFIMYQVLCCLQKMTVGRSKLLFWEQERSNGQPTECYYLGSKLNDESSDETNLAQRVTLHWVTGSAGWRRELFKPITSCAHGTTLFLSGNRLSMITMVSISGG